jgi:hypothetical protein
VKRWMIGGAVAAALVAGATGLAASAPSQGDVLGRLFLGPRMARAEVVLFQAGVAHDWRLDQGRVTAVRPTAVELVEKDGTRVVVPVGPAAEVLLNGQPATILDLTRGMTVLTARDGSAPATMVRARGRKAAKGP